jgi:hypothetical protein
VLPRPGHPAGGPPAARQPAGGYPRRNEIGRACTDGEGYARIRWTAPEAPGCWFIECRPASPALAADAGDARILVAALPPDEALLVVDIDDTVVRRQWGIITGSATPAPGAAEALANAERACDCQIVYLSARPDLLGVRSRDWLDSNGFPPGPLLLSQQLLPWDCSQRDYKEEKLRELKSRFRNIRAGIGDRLSDVQAYRTADVPLSIVILHPGDGGGRDGELCCLARRNARVRLVDNWQDAERTLTDALQQRVPVSPSAGE